MRQVPPVVPGADANLVAAKLAKSLADPANLGIGTLPGHAYGPIKPEIMQAGSEFLTQFLGLSKQNISLIPTKGGGSGAIATGIAAVRAMGYRPQALGFSPWDWAGYESFCAAQGLEKSYLPESGYTTEDTDTLLLVQTNRNGAGTRLGLKEAEALIKENNDQQRPNFIDLPYFTGTAEEKAVLNLFQSQAEQPTVMAWSPTKIFQTFAERPGGVVLILWPNNDWQQRFAWLPGAIARGTTGFDDATTRELWRQMAEDPQSLQAKHQHYLAVIKTATELWRSQAPAPAQSYFDDAQYGGMFRLFPADEDAQARLAAENIVAVLMNYEQEYRIRVNICGLIQPDGKPQLGSEAIIQTFFRILNF